MGEQCKLYDLETGPLSTPSHYALELFKAVLNIVVAGERVLDAPEDPALPVQELPRDPRASLPTQMRFLSS